MNWHPNAKVQEMEESKSQSGWFRHRDLDFKEMYSVDGISGTRVSPDNLPRARADVSGTIGEEAWLEAGWK